MTDFKTWWHLEGSTPPLPHEDVEEHCKRMCQIAWSNSAFVECEACAKVCEDLDAWNMDDPASTAAKAIRERNQHGV